MFSEVSKASYFDSDSPLPESKKAYLVFTADAIENVDTHSA